MPPLERDRTAPPPVNEGRPLGHSPVRYRSITREGSPDFCHAVSVANCVGCVSWATSIFASHALFMSELPETLKVGATLCRPQEPPELVRLDFDKFDGVP